MISTLDLARICGVSQGTVDRALHNRPGIGRETREKILVAAREHGYQPHPAARELLTGDRRVVGAIVPSVNSVFFMDLMNAIRAEIVPLGYHFFLSPATGREEFLHILRDFAARRARAVLFVPPDGDIAFPGEITAGGTALVSLANPCPGTPALFLGPDEVQTGRTAVEYLAGRGHRRILHVTYGRKAHAIEARARGYADAMAARGLEPAVLRPLEPESLGRAMGEYKPTALFCHNDWLALSVMRMLEARGLKVPGDISVLGVDNSPTFGELCPGITTLAYPAAEIARGVRELLMGGRPSSAISPCHPVEGLTVANIPGRTGNASNGG